MLANWLLLEYEQYGYLDSEGKLILPMSYAHNFIKDCHKYSIALVAVDFILRTEDDAYFYVHNLDCREILNSFEEWDELYKYCNQVVYKELQEESESDYIEYFIPYLMEEYEWRMSRMTEETNRLEGNSGYLEEGNA